MNLDRFKLYLAKGEISPARDTCCSPLAVVADSAPLTDLQKHDARFHPEGFKEGDSCKYRESLASGDRSDAIPASTSGEGLASSKTTSSAEYAAVVAKYKGTPQWMKAPNGEPTNLSERQWVQVRTPSFKKWFGDWENDPKNASKVVDENGEPKVVYHGTKEKFYYEFDTNVDDKGHIKDRNNSPGSFFAGTREAARAYSGTESGILYPQDIDEKMVREREGIVEGFGILDKYGTLRHQYGSDCFAETREALLDEFPLEEGDKVVPAYHTDYSTQCFPSIEALVKDERENNFEAYMDDKGGIYECFLNIRDPQVYDAHEDNWDAITTEYRVDINDGDDVVFFETEEEAIEYCKSHGLDPEEAVSPEQMSTNEIAQAVIDMGLDGAIIKNVTDSGGEWEYVWPFDDFIVFKPENIKSATHNKGTFLNFKGAVTDSAPCVLDLKKIAAAALAEDAAPRNPEFEEKHPRGNTRTGHKGQFRKSEKTLAKLDEADAALSPDGQTAFAPAAEYAAVEAKYKGTPEWMKAPNGKPTNLTERQWVQVRTPSFKKWFGDWENDPQNASKVVDSNGEPWVFYRGEDNETQFAVKKENTFYTDQEYNAREGYGEGGSVGAYFLNLRNPLSLIEEGSYNVWDKDKLIRFLTALTEYRKKKGRYCSDLAGMVRRDEYLFQRKTDDLIRTKSFIDQTQEDFEQDWKDVVEVAKSIGCDGLIGAQFYAREYLVFSPKNVKSATSNSGKFSPDAASTLDADPITRYLAQVEKDKGKGC